MKSFLSLPLLALLSSVAAQSSSPAVSPSASVSGSAAATSLPASGSDSASVSQASASASDSQSVSASLPASTTGSAALPASSSTTSSATTANLSATCAAFLNKLNSDSEISTCTAPLLAATSAFAPGTTSSFGSSTQLVSALDAMCKANGCSDKTIRAKLTDFAQSCEAELTGSNPVPIVQQTYDILYLVKPLLGAACTKDPDTGAYCAMKASAANTTSTAAVGTNNAVQDDDDETTLVREAVAKALAQGFTTKGLSRRQSSQSPINYAPNPQVWTETAIPFLFSLPGLSAQALCTKCTAAVLKNYVSWHTGTPYALGLANSPLLGGEVAIWKQIEEKCGDTYTQQIYAAQIPNNSVANGASSTAFSFATLFFSLSAVLAAAMTL